VLVDRSDIQEELVRLDTHVDHFLALLTRWRGWQEDGFPLAGNEPRGKYAIVKNFRLGRRGAEDYGGGLADEGGDRKKRARARLAKNLDEHPLYCVGAVRVR